MADDVVVLRDEQTAYDDGTVVKVRLLRVPESDRFEEGVKYALHYGAAGADDPIIRFDNHHGPHELHLGASRFEIEFPGFVVLNECFRAALPAAKRTDW
jgi:hypothetical protein